MHGLMRSWKWALFGVLLAIDVQLFHGVDYHQVLWQFPSSTILRSPCDVLVFCALLWDSRSATRIPMVFASLFVGAAVLFETDTGIYLGLTVACYLALTRWRTGALNSSNVAATVQTCVAPGAAALLLGLEIASRGQAPTTSFLSGWLEVFRVYPSGIGMLPINMSADGLLLSYVVIGVYLAVLCRCVHRWRAGQIERGVAIFACLAIYGLCYLCQFIGRSHPYNLFHSSIPFVILVVAGIHYCVSRILGSVQERSMRLSVLRLGTPILLSACVLLHITTLHGFQDYPNVFHPKWERAHVGAIGPEFAGTGVLVPVAMSGAAENFRAVTSDARRLSQSGGSVLFLVNNDPIYFMASGSGSRYRYSPLFHCLLSKSAQTTFERKFVRDRIDFVFVPTIQPTDWIGAQAWDVRQSLLRIVTANYRRDHLCGTFTVWRHL